MHKKLLKSFLWDVKCTLPIEDSFKLACEPQAFHINKNKTGNIIKHSKLIGCLYGANHWEEQ